MTVTQTLGPPPVVGVPAGRPRLFFVWFGEELPYFAELAIASACLRNPTARVQLLHGPELQLAHPRILRLCSKFGLSLELADVSVLLERSAALAPHLDWPRFDRIYRTLAAPAARSNIIRLLSLFSGGGIYLDTDTLCLKNLSPLLELGAFCGKEHILWSKRRLNRRRPYFWLGGPSLSLMRLALAHVPGGVELHHGLLPFYEQAVNNAVLGAEPGDSVIQQALSQVLRIPEAEWTVRFRFGTHLLQQIAEERGQEAQRAGADAAPPSGARGEPSLHLLPPSFFYPLGPVISRHYFVPQRKVSQWCQSLLAADTHVIHWYASVSELRLWSRERVLDERQQVPFAHLCAALLDEAPV